MTKKDEQARLSQQGGAGLRGRGKRRSRRRTSTHAQAPIKWRLQTYAGAALGEHVIKNSIDCLQQGGEWRDGDRTLLR